MNSLEKFIEISKGFTEEIQKESNRQKLEKRKLIVNKEIREEIEILSKDGERKQLPVFSHLLDSAKEDFDTDGTLHKAKIAWRALAGLQKHLENNKI